jgi:predicted O-methyltransferase YrrM
MNTREQLLLLDNFDTYYREMPFHDKKSDNLRYYFTGGYYGYSDAFFLYSMLRYLKPKNLIEIGSGFSSCVTLDTNELFMNNELNCVFIEPFAARLKSLLKGNEKAKIYEKRLQDIPLELFEILQEGDILFIDSTHISKLDSDVNYIIHKLLPKLHRGVYIHFHDIFFPFEYPKSNYDAGYAWNEIYMLRAFLEYNNSFKIILFNTYLQAKFKCQLETRFPLLYKNTGGSIWIQKCA